MTESYGTMMNYLLGVHTLGDEDEEVSVLAGGYVIVSTKETTTIKSQDNPDGMVFPRDMMELLVEMLRSHIPSNGEDDDEEFEGFTEQEAEARLP